MAQSSPSEFLTFYRRLTASQALKYRSVSRTTVRPFTASIRQLAEKSDIGGPGEDKKHALEKGDGQDQQSHQAQAGQASRAQGTGGTATEQTGQGSAKKAKEDFPEAPDAIGFQDERGGKGH